MREISLDTETTGLSFKDGDRITEIGCAEIIDKKITGRTYHTYINPERDLSAATKEITGQTLDFLKEFPTFKEVYQDFLKFIGGDRLVIHNAPFDLGFLNNELSMVGAQPLNSEKVVDTLKVTKQKFPGSPATLDALGRRFSINFDERVKHGALIDAKLLAEVYLQLSVDVFQNSIFDTVKIARSEIKEERPKRERIKTKLSVPSDLELKAHKEFLEKIKEPLWSNFQIEE